MVDILYSPLFINFSTVFVLIFLGFLLRDKNFVTENNLEFLNSFILTILLPCFIISSFMKDIHPSYLSNGLNIIIWAILVHIILFTLSNIIYKFNHQDLPEDDRITLRSCLPLGNITFYGVPVNTILYGSTGIFVSNMYVIINRILMNSAGLASMSGAKFTIKDIVNLFKNTTFQSTFVGATIFFAQEYTPQITIDGVTLSIFRIDHSLPFIFKGIESLGSMLSSLAWIIVGTSITRDSLKNIIKSPNSIIFGLHKTITVPMTGILTYIFLHQVFGFSIEHKFLPATLMLLITPVANTLVMFATKYKRSPLLCISCMVTSTIFSLFSFPLYHLLFDYLIQKGII